MLVGLFPTTAKSQDKKPIIDMHVRAIALDTTGDPPATICAPLEFIPSSDPKDLSHYTRAFVDHPPCSNLLKAPTSTDAMISETIKVLKELNITAATNGDPDLVARWKAAGGELIIPATDFSVGTPTTKRLRSLVKTGRIAVFAEIRAQYEGTPIDSLALDPYFALAEQLDIPVGIHMGPGPPGAPYIAAKNYRASRSSLFLLENVLARHPKLRIWAMHAGWPLGDDAVAMLYAHPQLYVDTGVIDYFLPKQEFYNYLKRFVDAGLTNRVMFGSDQMLWPEPIRQGVQNIEEASFLTEQQKRDILFNNPARFLRIQKN